MVKAKHKPDDPARRGPVRNHDHIWSPRTREEAIQRLCGGHSRNPYPDSLSTPGRGRKFASDGSALSFPGNTFICPIEPASRFYSALCELQQRLAAVAPDGAFVTLPPDSFHMTVFPGVCGSPLGHDGWPDGVSETATLTEMSELFLTRLSGQKGFDRVTIEATGLSHPFSVTVQPATPKDAQALWALRNILEQRTGIYRSDFHSYRFHVTLGYQLRWLTYDEATALTAKAEHLFLAAFLERSSTKIGPTEFREFESMFQFDPIAKIGCNGAVSCKKP